MNQQIRLEVGGQHFATTLDVLLKAETFRNMFEGTDQSYDNDEPIIINRSGEVFSKVLAYLIDNRYPFPKNLVYELEYFGIDYTVAEKHSEYITKTRHFFCLNDQCKEKLSPDEKYCDKHRCVMKGCHEAKCEKYCKQHEMEIGWCDETVFEMSTRSGFCIPRPKGKCGESKSCTKCKK